MRHPGPDRLLYVADAFRSGMTLVEIHDACKIDPWFLAQIEDLITPNNPWQLKRYQP